MSEPEWNIIRLILYFGVVYVVTSLTTNLVKDFWWAVIPKSIRLRREIIKKLSEE